MAEGQYLLGIDFGTEGVRVGVFDREGAPVAFKSAEFETRYPRPGWAEQDPDEWWSSLVEASRGAMEKSGIDPGEIAGIGVDATSSTVVAMDENDRHLRPALLWMDIRASDEATRIQETGNPALKYNGHGPVSAEWGLPKAMWLKKNEPETYENARHICDCGDWLIHRLTGEWAASINMASSKFYYDRDEGGFPEGLYEAVGIEDLLEKYPQNVLDPGTTVGELRREVAEELGLKAGTPVAEGAIDAYAGALGLGVVEPGKLALITGSSHVMIAQAAEPIYNPGLWGAYTDAMIPGQYTIEAGQVSTGSIVAWFKNRFAVKALAEAEKRGTDPYEILNEMAHDVPIGSDGLVVIDYFQGNRTPHVVSGGPAKSELWMQMHADVSNVPISLTKVSEGPVLGAAMLAAVGAGVYPDVQTAAEHMVHIERTIEPNSEAHEEYQFYVDRYVETYPQMKELMHKTVKHEASRNQPAAAEA
ncbi:MAG: xylulose kinase [Actinobacteria bacterium]|nr:xylulose kinase [Actinomycetota bacterium]